MWPFHNECTSKTRLVGKTAVITGANTGIGKETARDLYHRGARVILACRDTEKANDALEDIRRNPPSRANRKQFQGNPGELAIYHLDLCSLKSVKKCAKNLVKNESAIHLLINNAGVMMCPQEKTEDGFDLQLQTNYLVGAIHEDLNLEKTYTPFKGYAQSKLATVLFTKELARRLKEAHIYGINVYSLHPGVVTTELGRHFSTTLFPGASTLFQTFTRPILKNPEQGAQTTIYCSVAEEAANESGLYYKECGVATPHWRAQDNQISENLWNQTCQLLNLESDEDFQRFLKILLIWNQINNIFIAKL
ncbi:PREDICTED: retinol dehydrogenase 11-like isoform X2 [Vollenhovia emeryi]|uniref:retinol dehydrogenase 11-like isoform X2 n=1 Tax=Vollenhovia emeryi TaxID=411798 RepID=UPI0005F3A36E|nr:PREDICTED: retinol dehydrogenase 11-like isoform X2 [Vollenhovia emeryi]